MPLTSSVTIFQSLFSSICIYLHLLIRVVQKWANTQIYLQGRDIEESSISFDEFTLHWKAFKLKKLFNKADRRQSTTIQINRYLTKDSLPRLGHLPLVTIK